MMSSAVASLTPISRGDWGIMSRVSFPHGSLQISSSSIICNNKQDIFRCLKASSSETPREIFVRSAATNIESTNEADLEPQLLKNVEVLESNSSTVFKEIDNLEKKEIRLKRAPVIAEPIKKIDYTLVIKYPIVTESAIKAITEQNTLVFAVDKRADKDDIKNAFKKMLKINAKKVNTLMTPDGTKKAYVMLGKDSNALDIAKKIKAL